MHWPKKLAAGSGRRPIPSTIPRTETCLQSRRYWRIPQRKIQFTRGSLLKLAEDKPKVNHFFEFYSFYILKWANPNINFVRLQRKSTVAETGMPALVVGNPKLPQSITERWGWADIPHAEQEANMVAEMLQAKSLLGNQVCLHEFVGTHSKRICSLINHNDFIRLPKNQF